MVHDANRCDAYTYHDILRLIAIKSRPEIFGILTCIVLELGLMDKNVPDVEFIRNYFSGKKPSFKTP